MAGMQDETAHTGYQPERRHVRRKRVLKGAIVIRGVHELELACTIHNMSEEGAQIELTSLAHLPQEFLLYVALDGHAYRCELEWRHGEKAGVSFHGTEPKPPHHYG